MESKKTLFLLRGIPGCGKSTTADILSENGKYPVLSADMYFENAVGGYEWDGAKIKDAHAWCKFQLEGLMTDSFGENQRGTRIASPQGYLSGFFFSFDKIFVANTFTQEWEMEGYYELAGRYGYMVISLICENRHGGSNLHNVPEEKLGQMKERFQISL